MPLPASFRRAALVVAHPSHELRVHGWLEETRPYVCILTDGAGRSGEPRLSRTSEVLARVGATQGVVYGRLTDLEVYAAILKGDSELFAGLVEELAQAFVSEQIECVVGDAAEGYSVTHDICRVMIGAAVERAKQEHGHHIANYDFAVVGAPGETQNEDDIKLHLDDGAFDRKVNAALAYTPKLARDVEAALQGTPFQGIRRFSEPQLAGEVDVELSAAVLEELDSRPLLKAQLRDIVEGVPLDAFRVECLRAVDNRMGTHWDTNGPLFYELYGAKLVTAGRYEKAIYYREHMLPLAEAIRARTEKPELCVRSAS
ncbi:MAG TPA: hypothetical protein VJP89_03715 [Pyrinomonadaceae bacterium]|nr:hypothetical protein [Pyrinomonadaceae bacterium]